MEKNDGKIKLIQGKIVWGHLKTGGKNDPKPIKALPKPKVDRISVEMNIINKTRAESRVKFINLDYCKYLSGV